MNRITMAGAFLLANIAGPAMADCTSFGGPMTQDQVNTLLNPGGGVYTCYNPGSGRQNNETLLGGVGGGNFQDYKKGPGDPRDPSAVVGTYTLGTGTPGTVQYNYTVGGSYTYNICVTPAGNTYQFVNGGGGNLSIVVTTGPGHC